LIQWENIQNNLQELVYIKKAYKKLVMKCWQ